MRAWGLRGLVQTVAGLRGRVCGSRGAWAMNLSSCARDVAGSSGALERRRRPEYAIRRNETSVGGAVAGIVRRMARVHPSSAYWLALAALLPATTLNIACTSDDLIGTTGVDPSTTFIDTTSVNVFTTGEPDDSTSTGEPMMAEDTCREALMCITMCAIKIPTVDPPPEQDYSCFLPCLDGLTTEEWLALIDFGECVYNMCTATAQCPDVDDKPTCLNCLVTNLADTKGPMGCEMSSMTCK